MKKISANPDDDEGEPEYKFEWQVNLSFIIHGKWMFSSLLKVEVNISSLMESESESLTTLATWSSWGKWKFSHHLPMESESFFTHEKWMNVITEYSENPYFEEHKLQSLLILSFPREPGVTLQKKATLPMEINLLSSLLVFRWKVNLI